jgi:hypothetical protein
LSGVIFVVNVTKIDVTNFTLLEEGIGTYCGTSFSEAKHFLYLNEK